MASFKKFNLPFGHTNYPSSNEVTIYTQTAAQSSVVVGLSVSNNTEFDLPCDVWVLKGGGSTKHYLAKARRVPAGETIQLIDSGQKLVLAADSSVNDVVKANAPTVDGGAATTFSCWLSIYEDVNS
ncbi:hypothetical protein CMK18_24035 [Candidatus Poribacteria bacterium]|nr:hypothetical protein [Candidatus Poribacteria bacterium]